MSDSQNITMKNVYHVECIGPDGELKWEDEVHNLVTNVGLDDVLEHYIKGTAYTESWSVGLINTTPTVDATDTMASHGVWTEVTAYTEGVREDLIMGTVASQSVDNSLSKASFSINTNSTVIGGAFICDDNTKGGGTGLLYGAGAFTGGDKTADSGDTLNVTVTCTAASA